ncbi:MAG: endonuclease III [Methanobacterium sp.]|nr:endonuclease III [Methanobacterium sp.]
MLIKDSINKIMAVLEENYSLRVFEGRDPYRVLIRTILSQRTRDENTDQASKRLFSKYKNVKEVASADVVDLEELVRPAGFYHVKARRIKEVSQIILDEYQGIVPHTVEELLTLPGVGRKTANCLLVYGFGKPAICVDVHVHRISNRMGLVVTKNPDQTEVELMKIVPRKYWLEINDLLVQFGQTICKPISPLHEICPVSEFCKFYHDHSSF